MTRIRTVEYDADWGWIARSVWTAEEIIPGLRWRTRSVARTVVDEDRLLNRLTRARERRQNRPSESRQNRRWKW